MTANGVRSIATSVVLTHGTAAQKPRNGPDRSVLAETRSSPSPQHMSDDNMTPTLSVIIPSLMRSPHLPRILRVLGDSLEGETEVLLVADMGNGAQPSLSLASRQEPGLPVRVLHSLGGGPRAARNVGIREAKSDLVAFLDDDCIPDSDWCAAAREFMDLNPDCTGAGGLIIQAEVPSLVVDFLRFSRHLQKIYDRSPPPGIISANCVFRRRALLAVDGFDESFRHPGGEDVDCHCD